MNYYPMSTITIGLALIISLNGCATLFNAGNDKVDISSDPAGAKVYVNGQMLGKTPLQTKLPPNKTHYIEYTKEGYEKQSYVLSGTVGGGWVILDVLGGIIPVAIDAATGNWYGFDGDARVHLEKLSPPNSTNSSVPAAAASETVEGSSMETPTFFSIELAARKPTTILDEKVALTYESAGWGTSRLTGKGIWGFSEDMAFNNENMSIAVSKDKIVYVRVDGKTIYRIKVVQEMQNKLSLEFSKM